MSDSISSIWKSHLSLTEFRRQTIGTTALLTLFLFTYGPFILNIEKRQGVVLPDPLLNILPAMDLAWIVFSILYSCLIFAIYQLANKPILLVLGVQTFLLMYVFRTLAIYLTPFDPPAGYIPMVDPIVNILIPNSNILSRDLFFSGHSSVITITFLFSATRYLRLYTGICGLILMACLAIQHVHYSIDILIAPLVTYSSYRLVLKFQMANGILKEKAEEEIKDLGLVF